MKSTIVSLLILSPLSLITSCTVVETPEASHHTTSTTTAEVTPTVYGTVQTKTTRSY